MKKQRRPIPAALGRALIPAVLFLSLFLILLMARTGPVQADHLDMNYFPSDVWVKEPGVRLDFDASDPPGTVGFHTPYVFRFPDGTLRMYYDAIPWADTKSATSTDGLVWTKEPGIRLFGDVAHPHILQVGPGLFRMYVEKWGDGTIRSAISADGLNWTFEQGVRLGGVDPVVIELPGGGFRMYFRSSLNDTNIRSAISSDGLMWTEEPGIRITDAREFAAIRLPDGSVVIYFGPGTPAFIAILSARSTDGLNFTRDPGARLLPGSHPDSDPLDGGSVLTTSIVQFPGGVIRMYYQGSSTLDINIPGRVFSAVAVLAVDGDGDGIPHAQDNCPSTANSDQADIDDDGIPGVQPGEGDLFGGDACDPVINVTIDIKPGSYPNSIKLGDTGNVPVAIFGTVKFDVTSIDVTTLQLDSATVRLVGGRKVLASIEDINGDGLADLVVKFDRGLLDLTVGDGIGTVTGLALGTEPIQGTDSVRVIE